MMHGAAIYGVPWIPSRNTPFMLVYIPAPWILWDMGGTWMEHDGITRKKTPWLIWPGHPSREWLRNTLAPATSRAMV